MLDQILLLATLRHRDLDSVPGPGGERLGQKRTIVELMRDQNQPWTGLVVVELGKKGRQNLPRRDGAIGLRKICAIAPVLAGAEEEHLHTGEAALLMQREDVGFFHAARIDALM